MNKNFRFRIECNKPTYMLTYEILNALNSSIHVAGICGNIVDAFDYFNHAILLIELFNFGSKGNQRKGK
jgi:hypothetical protein